MPVPIKVRDNTNTIKVKVKDKSSEVSLNCDCDIKEKALDSKITKEREERIAADEELEKQINNKQDIIQFVNIDSESGTLPESMLKLLKDNNTNRLTYNNVIYYMSLKYGNVKKYFSRAANVELNEIDLNINTGDYIVISSIDAALQKHINNKVIHVSQLDRDRWDNKVNAQTELIDDEKNDYLLKLLTD